jgi:hypothetical protein
MEDDLKKKMEDNLQKLKTTSKKSSVLDSSYIQGKPFLGLAQLSKIFL